MGEDAGGAAMFDGIIKGWPEKWPEESTINVSNIPKEKKDFVVAIACDIYKNQKIEKPKVQAEEAIDHALYLYSALKSKGYL